MCLLKVYLEDEGAERKLIAQNVAFVSKEDGKVKLRDLELEETTLTNVDIFLIDALSSILILKKRKNST